MEVKCVNNARNLFIKHSMLAFRAFPFVAQSYTVRCKSPNTKYQLTTFNKRAKVSIRKLNMSFNAPLEKEDAGCSVCV
jgi:hypothetical protein